MPALAWYSVLVISGVGQNAENRGPWRGTFSVIRDELSEELRVNPILCTKFHDPFKIYILYHKRADGIFAMEII